MPLNLITDRTEQDVKRWEYLKAKNWENMTAIERSEWSNGLKGSYGVTDLNRVGEAVEYIAEQFRLSGYIVTLNPVKTDWGIEDKPTLEQLTEYLDNVSILKAILSNFPGTPDVPTNMKEITYQEANDIEQILFDIEVMLQKMRNGIWYSNAFMFYCGHDPLPSNLSEYVLADNDGVILVSNDNCIFVAR